MKQTGHADQCVCEEGDKKGKRTFAACDVKTAGGRTFRCHFELTLNVIGGKWKPIVLFYLSRESSLRFSELRRAIGVISEKMLAQQLKELEADGIVSRFVHSQIPPRVDYSLTELGRTLIPILQSMFDWGKAYEAHFSDKEAILS